MASIVLTGKSATSLLAGIFSLIFFIIASIEVKDGYFVIAILSLLLCIGVCFITEDHIKKIFQKLNIKRTQETQPPVIKDENDPKNYKTVVADPPVIKLSEVSVKS